MITTIPKQLSKKKYFALIPKLSMLLLVASLSSVILRAQTLDGYKYVYVETLNYQSGTDVWGISSRLRTGFVNKGFTVVAEGTKPPKELEQNACLLLRCFINHTAVVAGVNEVTITVKNCKDEVIYSNTGSAMGWSVQDDFNKATKRAFSGIETMTYRFNSTRTPEIDWPEVEITSENEESIMSYLNSNPTEVLEGIYNSYQNETLSFYKLGIMRKGMGFKAIVLESDLKHWKLGEVKAIFEPSSMKNVYSVKWFMGNKESVQTFAMMENDGILSIEFKNPGTGEQTISKFIKMFPAASGSTSFRGERNKSSGSGFFITADGLVATNAHVVEGASSIELTVSNEAGTFTYKAKIKLIDTNNDVAILEIVDDKFKGLNTLPYGIVENSEVGAEVFTIGFPLNDVMGENYKVTNGIVSAKSGIEDDVRYYQISVPLQPGNSGGALFNREGNVIGITSAKLNGDAVGTAIENVNYAIKSSYLLNLFRMIPSGGKIASASSVANKGLQEQVKVFKNYVCLIKVY
jgi:S1-C subfamily serine protease